MGENASNEEICRAYRVRALELHPDKNPEDKVKATIEMQLLNEAKFVLLDPKERQKLENGVYDRNFLPLLCSICTKAKSRTGSRCLKGMGHINPLIDEFNSAFKEYEKSKTSPDRIEFLSALEEVLKKFITIDFPRLYPLIENRKKRANSKQEAFPVVSKLGTCFFTSGIRNQKPSAPSSAVAVEILYQSLVRGPKENPIAHPSPKEILMYDLSSLYNYELKSLHQYFGFRSVTPFCRDSVIEELSSIIPACTVKSRKPRGYQVTSRHVCHQCGRRRFPFFPVLGSFPTCFACKSACCSYCLSNVRRKIPSSGSYELRTICKKCVTTLNSREAATWRAQGQFLLATDKKNLEAALAIYDLSNKLYQSDRVFIMQSRALLYCSKHEQLVRYVKGVLRTTTLERETAVELRELVAESLMKIADNADDSDLLGKAGKYEEAIKWTGQFSDESGSTFHDLKVKAMKSRLHYFEVHERVEKERIGKLLSHLIAAIRCGSLVKIFILLQDMDEDDKDMCLHQLSKEKPETYSQYGKLLLRLAKTTLTFKKDPTGAVGQMADILWTGYSLFLGNGSREHIFHFVSHFTSQLLKAGHGLFLDTLHEITPTIFLQCLHLTEDDIISPPDIETTLWKNVWVEGCDMKLFLNYELAVKKLFVTKHWSPVKVAFSYFDLTSACKHPSQLLVTLITSAQWFSKQMSLPNSNKALQYSCKKMILRLTNHVAALSFDLGIHPHLQYYMARMVLGLQFYASCKAPCGSQDDAKCIGEHLNWLVASGRLCPLHKMPVVSPTESVILHKMSQDLYCEYLLNLQDELPPQMRPMPEAILRYHIYENHWQKRCQLHDPTGNGLRLTAMTELLLAEDLSWDAVQKLLQWNLVPTDSEGWLVRNHQLLEPVASSGIHQLVGLEVNKNDNGIQLLIKKSTCLSPSLLCREDIAIGLAMDSQGCFFSLDPVTSQETRCHPFNKLTFMPQQLQESGFLSTLLHSDYLLKQLSTGFEISLHPPFHKRPVYEGLIKGLPERLQKALLSVPSRGPSVALVHRFWIEAEAVEWDVQEDDESTRWLFGNVKMAVRCQPMRHTPFGGLEDLDGLGPDPDSPEGSFIADFTRYYDEIGDYFPQLLRLKELCKVQFLGALLANYERELEEDLTRIVSYVHEEVDAKNDIIYASALQKAQEESEMILSSILHNVSQDHWREQYLVYIPLSFWEFQSCLLSGNSSAIVRKMAHQMVIDKHAGKLEQYQRSVSTLLENSKKCLPSTNLVSRCCWVPAVCHCEKGNLIYGGVSLMPKKCKATLRGRSDFSRVPLTPSFFGSWETVKNPPVKPFNPPRINGRKSLLTKDAGPATCPPGGDSGDGSSSGDSENLQRKKETKSKKQKEKGKILNLC